MGDVVRREEAEAALAARRELGAEYDDELVDAFIAKLDERLRERDAQLQRRRDHQKEVLLSAMGISIPLLAIAAVFGGLPGIAIVCGALAVIALATRPT